MVFDNLEGRGIDLQLWTSTKGPFGTFPLREKWVIGSSIYLFLELSGNHQLAYTYPPCNCFLGFTKSKIYRYLFSILARDPFVCLHFPILTHYALGVVEYFYISGFI